MVGAGLNAKNAEPGSLTKNRPLLVPKAVFGREIQFESELRAEKKTFLAIADPGDADRRMNLILDAHSYSPGLCSATALRSLVKITCLILGKLIQSCDYAGCDQHTADCREV